MVERFSQFEDRLRKAAAATAGDLMTPDPITIEPDSPVSAAAQTKHNRLRVNEHGRLIGVVTRLDVLEALTRE